LGISIVAVIFFGRIPARFGYGLSSFIASMIAHASWLAIAWNKATEWTSSARLEEYFDPIEPRWPSKILQFEGAFLLFTSQGQSLSPADIVFRYLGPAQS
jgi:hypothetical protein